MRKTETQRLGDVINQYLDALKLKGKMNQARIGKHWQELMGHNIAKKTEKIYIKNEVLYIYLHSSVLRNELLMMKSKLIDALNKKMGDGYIKEIVLR